MQDLVQDIWCTRNSKERPYTWRQKSPLFRDDWIFGWLVGDSLRGDTESVDVMPSYLVGSHYQQSFSPGRPNSIEVCNSRVQTSFHNTLNLIGSRCNSFVMIVTRGQDFGNLMPRLFMKTSIVKYLTRI